MKKTGKILIVSLLVGNIVQMVIIITLIISHRTIGSVLNNTIQPPSSLYMVSLEEESQAPAIEEVNYSVTKEKEGPSMIIGLALMKVEDIIVELYNETDMMEIEAKVAYAEELLEFVQSELADYDEDYKGYISSSLWFFKDELEAVKKQ